MELTAWCAFPPECLAYICATHLTVNFAIFQSGNLITFMDRIGTVLKLNQKCNIEMH